jgi:hypothetical protein
LVEDGTEVDELLGVVLEVVLGSESSDTEGDGVGDGEGTVEDAFGGTGAVSVGCTETEVEFLVDTSEKRKEEEAVVGGLV